MNYDYIRQVELLDGSNLHVGSYDVATWSSTSPSNVILFTVEGAPGVGILEIDISSNAGVAKIRAAVDGSQPAGTYTINSNRAELLPESFMYSAGTTTSGGHARIFRLKFPDQVTARIHVHAQLPNITISEGGSWTTGTEFTKTSSLGLLVYGQDYGPKSSLPAAGNAGRMFFVQAES